METRNTSTQLFSCGFRWWSWRSFTEHRRLRWYCSISSFIIWSIRSVGSQQYHQSCPLCIQWRHQWVWTTTTKLGCVTLYIRPAWDSALCTANLKHTFPFLVHHLTYGSPIGNPPQLANSFIPKNLPLVTLLPETILRGIESKLSAGGISSPFSIEGANIIFDGLVLGKFSPRPIGTQSGPDQTQQSWSRSGIFPKILDHLVSGLGIPILPKTISDPVWTGTA